MNNPFLMQDDAVHNPFITVTRVPPSGKSVSIRHETFLTGIDDTDAAKHFILYRKCSIKCVQICQLHSECFYTNVGQIMLKRMQEFRRKQELHIISRPLKDSSATLVSLIYCFHFHKLSQINN